MLVAFFFFFEEGHGTFEMWDLAGGSGFLEVSHEVYSQTHASPPTSVRVSSLMCLLSCLFCHDGLHQENMSLNKPLLSLVASCQVFGCSSDFMVGMECCRSRY